MDVFTNWMFLTLGVQPKSSSHPNDSNPTAKKPGRSLTKNELERDFGLYKCQKLIKLMNMIAKGKDAVEFLSGKDSLISGELERISVYRENDKLLLDLTIALLYSSKFRNVTLRFIDVIEYSFYYKNHNAFYYIEDYKFFATAEQIYISLDPADCSDIDIDLNDNDFVLAKNLEIYAEVNP